MGAFLGFIFCVLVLSTKTLTVQSAVYSNSDIALRFSQCLVEKMSESQYFTFEDINTMFGVADVMSQAMQNLDYGRKGPFSVKILLIAFVTSLADVIILQDPSKNILRRAVYATALEQCSMSATEHIDSEFIKDSLRIISTLEESKVPLLIEESDYGDIGSSAAETNPQTSDVFNPFAVLPSPVENPFIPVDFDPNAKTIFSPPEDPLDFSPFLAASHSDANSRFPARSESASGFPSLAAASSNSEDESDFASTYPKSKTAQSEYDYSFDESFVAPSFEFGDLNLPHNEESSAISDYPAASQTGISVRFEGQAVLRSGKNSQLPIKSSSNKDLFSGPDVSSITSDSEVALSFSDSLGSSDATSLRETSLKPSIDFGGYNVPQMKESSIDVLPPIIPPQADKIADQSIPEMAETLHQPSKVENAPPQKVSSFSETSSASLSQTDKTGPSVQFDPTLENIVLNILSNSSTFSNAFSFGINSENAVSLARAVTEQSLTGYNSDIISEVLNAVSNAVATVRISTPENYAIALSNALVSVLKLHNLPLFVHGSKIATSILSNLETTIPAQSEIISEPLEDDFASDDYVKWEEKQSPFDYQSRPIAPEDTDGEAFSEALTRYLLKSDEMANFFCSSDSQPNRLQIYFSIIKSSLLEFGAQIASIGASVTCGILSELSDEYLCTYYAQTISDSIAEVLDENGLLSGANAENVANRMVFSLSQQFPAATKPQTPEITVDDLSEKSIINQPLETMTTLQPSLSSDFDKSDQEASALSSIHSQPSTCTPFEDTSDESTGEKYNVEPTSHLFTTATSPIQISSAEELEKGHEIKNDYTSPFSTEIADEELISATTWMDPLSSLSESSATEKTTNYASHDVIPGISDDGIDQEELASFLLEQMESVLDAFNDQEISTDIPSDDACETETEANPVSNNQQTDADDSQSTESVLSRNRQENGRRKQKTRPTTTQPDTTEESIVSDDITLPGHQVKIRSSRRRPGSIVSVNENVSTSNTYSKDSDVQPYPVVLQPSFQAPQSSESSSASSKVLPQVPSTVPYDFDSEDASFVFAKAVSQIVADSISYIKSDNFHMHELCGRLNELAPILKIPPLHFCQEIPLIDYLLHVLGSVIKVLKGV